MFKRIMALAAAGLLMASAAWAQPPIVHVAQGDVTGTSDHGAQAWLGLPYAAPPVGRLRWRPPVPAQAWTGVRTADRFGSDCRQTLTPDGLGPWTREYQTQGPVSEDCLYLNIWRPEHAGARKLAVMVWIHGGAFTGGSGAVPIYNGAGLAKQGIIVVTLNYRLSVYGFLAQAGLTQEDGRHSSGNYGLLDQIAALRWVHDNIAAFGGDPSRVTLAGQSAGAASVHDLIASPLAAGLFQRAIAESGSGMGTVLPSLVEAEAKGARLMAAAGVTTPDALRALDPAMLEAAVARSGVGFSPVADGVVVPDMANRNDVPMLTGLNANETSSNGFFQPDTLTPETFRAFVAATYGPLAPAVLIAYPPGDDDASARASRDALARDRGLAALDLWAENRLRSSHQPIYGYLWSHVEPGPEATRYGAFHSSELAYVFGTLNDTDRPITALDRVLSRRMLSYWAQWIKTGNPNGAGESAWPRFDAESRRIVEIDDMPAARPVLPPEVLDLFKRQAARGGYVGIF